jgi:predicted enzyme related to lactoylglutathione lyase
LGSRSVQTGSTEGIAGGIWQIPSEAHAVMQLFIRTDDLTAYVKRVEAGGGKVPFPPQVLPSGDEVSICQDPEGIPCRIFQPSNRS